MDIRSSTRNEDREREGEVEVGTVGGIERVVGMEVVEEVDEVRAGGRRFCKVLGRVRWEERRWRLMEVWIEEVWEVCTKEPSSVLQRFLDDDLSTTRTRWKRDGSKESSRVVVKLLV